MTRRTLALVAASLVAGCSPSHRVTVVAGPPAAGVELPLRFVYNLPVTDVEIGDGTAALIVDLGGHDTIALEHDAVTRLESVKPGWKRAATVNASGKLSFDRDLTIPEAHLGAILLRDIGGHEISFGGPEGLTSQVDGYLGAAILTRFALLVDYPDRIVLYPPGVRPAFVDAATWIAAPLDADRSGPAMLGGAPVEAGWDTGASHTVIARKHADRLGGGDPVTASLAIAGHDFGPMELRVHSLRGPGFDVLIGHDFFAQRRVFFDFAGETVWIETGR